MARNRGRSSLVVRGRSSGRLTEWFGSADQTAAQALAAGSFILSQSLNAAALAKRPFTITRTVGSIWVQSDNEAAAEFPFGAVGAIVVSEKAAVAGAASVPDPITEESSDEWFMYRSFAVASTPIVGRMFAEFAFDSRAQRKVQDGEQIVWMVANANAGHGLAFVLKFRLLVKLS